MDDDAAPVIEFDELKRLRDQIKNLKLENDELRQRNLPTLSDHKPTVWTNPEPDFDENVEENGDDVLADVLEINDMELADEETWLSPTRGGSSGVDLTAWLRHGADSVLAGARFEDNRMYSDSRRSGVDCRTFTRRKTPARPPLRFSPVARGLDSTFRVLSEPHLNLTQELRLMETSSSQDELNGTYHISSNHLDEFLLSDQMEEFHLSSQRAELYESTNMTNVFHTSNGRHELQATFNQIQESHSTPFKTEVLGSTYDERAAFRTSPNEKAALRMSPNERAAFRGSPNERAAARTSPNERAAFRSPSKERAAFRSPSKERGGMRSPSKERGALRAPSSDRAGQRAPSNERQDTRSAANRRSASWDSLDERPMDDVRSMARLQEQSLNLAMSTPHPNRAFRPVAVDDGLPSPIPSETSSSGSSRAGSAGNVAVAVSRAPPTTNELPKMKPVSAAAAASRPGGRASGLPRPMSRIPAPRARKPAWADGCY